MKDIKTAIVHEFMERTTFAEIAQSLNGLSAAEKTQFVQNCISGTNGSFLKGVCLSVARTKAQAKFDQIKADGIITLTESNNILKFL
jgi:hypothetical protein